jgi:chemotaxis protein methyltransferase CheR
MRWTGFRKVRRQVCKRVDRRLRELGLPDVQAYRDYLAARPGEWSRLDSFCRISISRLYRDQGVFNLLRDEVLPSLAATAHEGGRGSIRCWSAGCASGEEVYTLSILWTMAVQPQFPEIELQFVATDSDPQMLARAQKGCYSTSSLKDVPKDWLTRAFTTNELYCVRAEFREPIEFLQQDIRLQMPAGPFRLILCRHLAFTYFDQRLQVEVLRNILARLAPDGFLVAGKQERLPEEVVEIAEFRPHTGVYRRLADVNTVPR